MRFKPVITDRKVLSDAIGAKPIEDQHKHAKGGATARLKSQFS